MPISWSQGWPEPRGSAFRVAALTGPTASSLRSSQPTPFCAPKGRLFGPLTGQPTMTFVRWRSTLANLARGLAMAVGGVAVARVHLWIFYRHFLE